MFLKMCFGIGGEFKCLELFLRKNYATVINSHFKLQMSRDTEPSEILLILTLYIKYCDISLGNNVQTERIESI